MTEHEAVVDLFIALSFGSALEGDFGQDFHIFVFSCCIFYFISKRTESPQDNLSVLFYDLLGYVILLSSSLCPVRGCGPTDGREASEG